MASIFDSMAPLFEKKDSGTKVDPVILDCQQKLAELDGRKEELIVKIGHKFYADNKDAQKVPEGYGEFIDGINRADEEKEIVEKRLLAAQGLRKCTKCGSVLSIDSAFCNKCGEKLAPLFTEEVKTSATEVPEESGTEAPVQIQKSCPNCGKAIDEGVVFCMNCGTKVG